MTVKAFGTFQSKDSKIFRTEAHLQWGNSETAIGLVIMLNPGSSSLSKKKMWDDFIKASESGKECTISGELEMDSTMKALKEHLTKINGQLVGRLHIYNLFNYRCGNSNDALRTYSSLLKDQELINVLHSPIPSMVVFPWIWVAWSVNDRAILNKRKKEILQSIPLSKKISIYSRQKKHQKRRELYCYHPNPQKQETRNWVQSEILREVKKHVI